MIRVEPSVLLFLAIISKSVNNRCYTTHTFSERSRKDLSENVWVVALIVYRFRDKRQKHQHGRLNSYRGDYSFRYFLTIELDSHPRFEQNLRLKKCKEIVFF